MKTNTSRVKMPLHSLKLHPARRVPDSKGLAAFQCQNALELWGACGMWSPPHAGVHAEAGGNSTLGPRLRKVAQTHPAYAQKDTALSWCAPGKNFLWTQGTAQSQAHTDTQVRAGVSGERLTACLVASTTENKNAVVRDQGPGPKL